MSPRARAKAEEPAEAGQPWWRAASQPGVDAQKLEQLLGFESRLQDRRAAQAYAVAFTALSAELPVIEENGELRVGEEVVATYALWEDINEVLRPLLSRHGFALSFRTGSDDGGAITVTAVLTHKRGHREETTLRLPADLSGDKNPVQAVGSSVSYGKRYAASALLNLTTRGSDDDGQAAGGVISPEQVKELQRRLADSGGDPRRFLSFMRVGELKLLPANRYEAALQALDTRLSRRRSA